MSTSPLLLSCMLASVMAAPAVAREPRSRKWLLEYVNRPIPDTPRNRRYIRHVNARSDKYCDVDVDWLERGRSNGLNPGRAKLGALARLSFSVRARGMKYHRNKRAWRMVRAGLLGVAANIRQDGRFEWGPKGTPTHEQAWFVERSLLAFLWAQDRLEPADREQIRDAIGRAAALMIKYPRRSHSNQASVWSATAALAAVYFEKPEWMAAADRHADGYVLGGKGNIYDDGEIGEHHRGYRNGGGPDCNYSYTGLSGIYPYRLWSGRNEIDPLLAKAARWMAGFQTLSGCVVVPGASPRYVQDNPPNLRDVLPFWERMSRTDPFFGRLAGLALDNLDANGNAFDGHLASGAIWAMLEAGKEGRRAPLPGWQASRTAIYGPPQRRAISYALISRPAYQTGVVFSTGVSAQRRWPARGLQTWAWKEEPPVLMYVVNRTRRGLAAEGFSTVRVGDVDTAATDVSRLGDGWDVHLQQQPQREGQPPALTTIIARRGRLWEVYAVTGGSLVVVHGGGQGRMRSRWVLNPRFVPRGRIVAGSKRVSFRGRRGSIHYLLGSAKIARGERTRALHVDSPGPVNAFGFSDPRFRFGKWDAAGSTLRFSDGSGRYRLDLGDVLAPDGTINRRCPLRLSLDGP